MKLLKAPLYFLNEYEMNGYQDSDFYDVVFDWTLQEIKHVEVGSTRYGGPRASCRQDVLVGCEPYCWPCFHPKAPSIVLERVAEITANMKKQAEAEREALRARTPSKGKVCRVIAGRKIPKGTIVKCLGDAREYRWSYHSTTMEILVACPDGRAVRTNIKNLEVV